MSIKTVPIYFEMGDKGTRGVKFDVIRNEKILMNTDDKPHGIALAFG
ncbi:MAG: hypothetical protein AABY54_10800 [Deltaproteobacteria bacterium]